MIRRLFAPLRFGLWLLFLLLTGCGLPQTAVSPPTLVPTAAALATLPPVVVLPTMTPSPLPTNTAVPPTATAVPPTSTVIPATNTPTPTATPAISFYQAIRQATPSDTPLPYLSQTRLVAYYGSPTGPGLGILGELPFDEMVAQLRETAVAYANLAPDRPVTPTFHMIVTVADTTPPYYRHHIDLGLIERWIDAAAEAEVAVILDIQPGQARIQWEYERIRPFLFNPHVHLAIDPEFTMAAGQVPAQVVGQLYASDINQVQADLNTIATEIGVNRVLILHQFSATMLPNKEEIVDYPYVEMVIDGDGVGSPQAKLRNYHNYASEPAFEYGGFKLFPTDGDWPVLSPQEVMSQLAPPPTLIIYQ